ncbi:MAG TPA: hypothetical protein VFE47_00040 [Tepidisphaeraceae bacterium]|jgi:hypothetical protein|nr:hypothetical protein [Tepidisphaeraceae bacterium]
MFGSDLYAAMVEVEANDLEADRHRRQMHRAVPAPSAKDIAQDSRIRQLEHENQRLKGCFSALVQVLLEKDLINADDVRAVLRDALRIAG